MKKVDSPLSFVVITVGSLPPEVPPEVDAAATALLPLFSNSLAIGPHLRGSALGVCAMDPLALLTLLDSTIPKVPSAPQLVGH